MVVYARHLILGSASPRRRELLEAACFEVEVRAPNADETWPNGMSPHDGTILIAERKLVTLGDLDDLALAADTVVVVDNDRLGKPADEKAARQMLRKLSGRAHEVVTGFCASRASARRRGAVVTKVWFRSISDAEIERYVQSGEPFDKAGAYAIQGRAGAFVARVEGSYTNIVGLPLAEVIEALRSLI
jgi:septum formation protein